MRRYLWLLLAPLAALSPGLGSAHPLPGAPSCRLFPADNSWNQRVERLPVARNSAGLISQIGLGSSLHPDFGTVYAGAPNGIPITVVASATPTFKVRFTNASESDRARYPIPRHVAIEGGPRSTGDRHLILLDRSSCRDYELYAAYPHNHGRSWTAGSGAIFNLASNHLRPAGWTSADAAGLPILPGLARYDEVRRGLIDHALRFTAPCTAPRYVYPARHFTTTGKRFCPPMGLRVRLKAAVHIAGLPYQARVVAQALKRYGMILADNGAAWYISGAPDRRWNDSALHLLGELTGRDFQVVDTSSLPHPGR